MITSTNATVADTSANTAMLRVRMIGESTEEERAAMSDREKQCAEIVKHLQERAEFWAKFPAHQATARILKTEAYIIERDFGAKSK